MQRYFHDELQDLRNKLILLGEKSHEAARLSVESLLDNDLEQAEKTLALDDSIDALEKEIGHACTRYISLRSPVSTDLRLILVALKASHDFERVGDEAHTIARKTRDILTREGRFKPSLKIREMSRLSCKLIHDAITCFVEEDIEKAKAVIALDREVDALNNYHYEALASKELKKALTDASRFDAILVSKAIERIGDHAKNLANEVIFLLNGD
ncbi:MAG: Phosphate-specific transport system accessory protein PhoU [Opitutia bacterium UBA7350]|nr:MAG: Phosphate-specific transport system accessory protein PhoU [Opitutae bacterium UBA7350]